MASGNGVTGPGLVDAGLPEPGQGVFTTRAPGPGNLALHVSDDAGQVLARRTAVRERLGVGSLVFADQVHGARVVLVDDDQGTVPDADALVVRRPDLAVAVLAADCLPVLLVDPVARLAAAVHAGRAGLVAGVLLRTLEMLVSLGARQVAAVVGPAVCAGCYELPDALADEVGQAVPGCRSTTRRGTASVDLRAGAQAQLAQADSARLEVTVRHVGGCTQEQPDRFSSHRGDPTSGRHAGVVWLG